MLDDAKPQLVKRASIMLHASKFVCEPTLEFINRYEFRL